VNISPEVKEQSDTKGGEEKGIQYSPPWCNARRGFYIWKIK